MKTTHNYTPDKSWTEVEHSITPLHLGTDMSLYNQGCTSKSACNI